MRACVNVFIMHVYVCIKGFCLAETTDGEGGLVPKAGIDASGTTHLVLDVRSKIAYTGKFTLNHL